jgi:hypothetical protein
MKRWAGANACCYALDFTIFLLLCAEPSMPSQTTSTTFKNFGSGMIPAPKPGGVPVMITSPGCKMKNCGSRHRQGSALSSPEIHGFSPPTTRAYGHFTTGGNEDKIDSTLPPVRKPKIVPRS